MEARLIPLTLPGIDLKAFVGLLGQPQVSEVDSKPIQPVAKFAKLVDILLPQQRSAYSHIYQAFYFELPRNLFCLISSFNLLTITVESEGGLLTGIMSGSIMNWKDMHLRSCEGCNWNTTLDGELKAFAQAIDNFFRQFLNFAPKALR